MRLRFRFAKLGKVRWTSHRDVARMWERALRRAEVPLAYSEGFSPRPRVSFGLALPTGHESLAEYLDVSLAAPLPAPVPDLLARLSAALPVGVDAVAVAELPPASPSLQEAVTSCTWEWDAAGAADPGALADRCRALLSSPSLVLARTRKGREATDDVRPAVIDLAVVGEGDDGAVRMRAELATRPVSLRPAELLAALGDDLDYRRPRRLHQWMTRDGARCEPLDGAAPAAGRAGALERAS